MTATVSFIDLLFILDRFDGFVVCEEYADTLMVAWTEDQEIQEQRETEVCHKGKHN